MMVSALIFNIDDALDSYIRQALNSWDFIAKILISIKFVVWL